MKSQIQKTLESLKLVWDQAKDLEERYKGKTKGEIYQRRLKYLQERFEHYTKKMGELGTGKINRYQFTLEEPEQIFTVKVWYSAELSLEDVQTLVKFRYEPVHIIKGEVIDTIEMGKFNLKWNK